MIFLEKVDSVILQADEFSVEFDNWLTVSIEVLNSNYAILESQLNGTGNGNEISRKTQAEIIALSADAQDGTLWYCIDHAPPCFVGKENGALVQILTAAFP